MHSTAPSTRFDVYRTITDTIIQAIEAGASAFVMPWHQAGPGLGRPVNAATGLAYRGLNVVALWAHGLTHGYTSGWWATYAQWRKLGAQVRKGARGAMIVVYRPIEAPDDQNAEDRPAPRRFARAFTVFNQAQVSGWHPPEPELPEAWERLNDVERFIDSTGATIRFGGGLACYQPNSDIIFMPEPHRFVGSDTRDPLEAYYAVLLHELTHWTGAEHRLDRAFGKRFGDEAYAMEELVAELGGAFLCADLAITNEPRPDHAAYVAEWLSVLRNDRRAIFTAAQKAKEAVDYLTGLAGGSS